MEEMMRQQQQAKK